MFLAAKEFPLPVEYRFLPLEEVFHEPPADVVDRTLVFLDCGNIDRMPVEFLQRTGARLVNIDHHHDNTRFGDRQPGRHRGLVHCGDRAQDRQAARGGDHPGDRLMPSTSGWSPTPACSCTRTPASALAPDGGRADRGRASTSTTPTAASTSGCRSRSCTSSPARWEKVQRFDDDRLAIHLHFGAEDYAASGRR